jgi:hypothetical protein
VSAVGVSVRLCVLTDEVGCFGFWSFCIRNVVMRVYTVGGDGHVSSCLGGLVLFYGVL